MIIFEFIIKLIARFLLEIIFEGILKALFQFFIKSFDFIRYDIIGLEEKENTKNHIIDLEKRWLYKKIVLKEALNLKFKKGQQGAVLEIVDQEKVYAEFYDQNGKQIEFDNTIVFEVRTKHLRLEK